MDRFLSFNTYLRNRYGKRVQKITIDAGFTCPNRDGRLSYGGCIYCDPFGSGSGESLRGISVEEQIRTGASVALHRYKTDYFILYFQAFTNTYAPLERLKQVYDDAVFEASKYGRVVGISIGTRPDCVPNEVLDMIASYLDRFEVWLEFGVQTIHFNTLKNLNRRHGVAEVVYAILNTHSRGIKVCAHVIFGLPGETKEDMLETTRVLSVLGIDGIKMHPLYVVRGTPLHRLVEEGKYLPIGLSDFVDAVVSAISVLPPSVVVQRITGEAPSGMLVAPEWTRDKHKVRELILRTLKERDIWQGKDYKVGLSLDELRPFSS